MVVASKRLKKYFEDLENKTKEIYDLANKARKSGIDPTDHVEIKLAKNMAERVFGLVSVVAPNLKEKELIERIHELEEKYGILDWRVALTIGLEIAEEKFGSFDTKKEAIEVGIRTGFAYHTVGIVAAPLEGFTELKIKKRRDGKEYFSIWFSGPIRGAGGTAAAFCVLLSDYIRKKTGYFPYDPDENEVKRYITELSDYNDRVTNLQYNPSEKELAFLIRHLPIEVSGDPTEDLEVSNYKDLPRIETNRIRGGMTLVMSMIALKAPKLWKRISKWGKDFDLEWFWLEEFLKIQEKAKAEKGVFLKEKEQSNDEDSRIKPNYAYISEIIAGRPVFSYPLRSGGFRMRYGRSRTTGLSAAAIHPSTMSVVEFIATGTQLKVEMPGKAASITSCDSIEPPIVLLNNGNVIKLRDPKYANKIKNQIKEIVYLGDILFNYGDFSENNHMLVPPGYCPEWWFVELESLIVKSGKTSQEEINSEFSSMFSEKTMKNYDIPSSFIPTLEESLNASKKYGVPLHPEHIFYWTQITISNLIEIYNVLKNQSSIKKDRVIIKIDKSIESFKRALELLGVEHELLNNENIVISKETAFSFLYNLGIKRKKDDLNSDFANAEYYDCIDFCLEKIKNIPINELKTPLDLINRLSDFKIKDKAGTFIGARMGRPEKAKMRQLIGSPQMLFPIGDEGGRLRSFNAALEKGFVTGDFSYFECPNCKNRTVFRKCEKCGSICDQLFYCDSCKEWMKEKICPKHNNENQFYYKDYKLNLKQIYENSNKLFKMNGNDLSPLVKGVRGTMNKDHLPEHFVKGILRAKHSVYVNKDGTVRYDMTELPITHFKPKEVNTSIEKLKELGYSEDIYGNPLEQEDQVLEIFPQDVILPLIPESFGQGADVVFKNVADFIDELLERVYGMDKFYNVEKREDLVGALVIGLAPHISAGTVGRIIGFSKSLSLTCSPLFHAALRRDCDGDEGCILLALDAFINFSQKFLPDRRGSRTMDAPLVLTVTLNPSEVDDMVLGMDVVWKYPLEFYDAALNYKMPYEIQIEQLKKRIGTEKQYENFGFTHPNQDFQQGLFASAYKIIPSMLDKLDKEMELAVKIRAVDESDVARLIIEKHFMKDLKGNLRKFSMQRFRCVNCNTIYRRPPLSGKCQKCNGKIIFTISEGSVLKYLKPSLELAEKYDVPTYLKQSLKIVEQRVYSMFGKEKERQEGLSKFLKPLKSSG